MESTKIYYRYSRNEENIIFQDQHYTYPLGGIVCEIANWDTGVSLNRFIATTDAPPYYVSRFARRHPTIFDVLQFVKRMPVSPLIQNLLLWTPLFELCSWGKEYHSAPHTTLYEHHRSMSRQSTPGYYRQSREHIFEAESYSAFCKILSGTGHESDVPSRIVEHITRWYPLYFYRFRELCVYLSRLRNHINAYSSLTPLEEENFKQQFISYPSYQTSENNIFHDTKPHTKYSNTYVADRIEALIALELMAIDTKKKHFTKCGLCGRIYISYSNKGQFCSNPNPKYQNSPCKVVGPRLRYRGIDAAILPQQALLAKNTAAYEKWCLENKAWCRANISHPFIRDCIIEDIDFWFTKWKKEALSAQKECAHQGPLSEEVLIKALALPEIWNRSPSLDTWKFEERIRKKISD